jgi:hypothetical protein
MTLGQMGCHCGRKALAPDPAPRRVAVLVLRSERINMFFREAVAREALVNKA